MSTTRTGSFEQTLFSGRALRLSSRALTVSAVLLAACGGVASSDDEEKVAEAEMALSSGEPGEEQLTASQAAAPPGTVTTSEDTGWRETGSLAAARLLHTAVRLEDGQVLVVGGYNASAEIYDPATGAWSPTGQAPGNYRGATATLLGSGKVLVAGAADSGVSAALYDPTTGTWSATGGLATPRYNHAASLLPDGRVLVTGGGSSEYGNNALASAEIYDPATGAWAPAGALGTARRGHTATLLESGKVLVTGGNGASGRLASAELYDPQSGAWTSAGAMGMARAEHAATALPSGKVLVTGGGADGAPAAGAELYDPATQSWSAAASMHVPRRRHSATLLPSGKVLVTGGYDDTTGIQHGAELYDPARGAWDPMPAMAAGRYQHTATLLDNGRLLVAGGFSNGDQASAEVFAASYVEVALDGGDGWKLVNISGSNAGDGAQPYDADLLMVNGEVGVANAPLPDGIRADLVEDAAAEESVYFFNPDIVADMAIYEQTGVLTPALEAIAEPADAPPAGLVGSQSLFGIGKCSDTPVTRSKSVNLTSALNFTQNLGDGLSGTLYTRGNILGNAWASVQLRVKRRGGFGVCIPYAVELDHVSVNGTATLDQGTTLEATLMGQHTWEVEVARPSLGGLDFKVGAVKVHLGFSLPITLGLDLTANATGTLTYASDQSTSITFNNTCRLSGCTGSTTVTAPPFRDVAVQGDVVGRIQPSVWVQPALRVSLFHDNFAHAQVGLRPTLHGDLWGHHGYGCGDADGIGGEDLVQARTFDLDWQLRLTAQVGAASQVKKWNALASSPRWNVDFWNLLGSGSTALEPMLVGPASVERFSLATYQLKMRPCWPYSDPVNYEINWDDFGYVEEAFGDAHADIPRSHAWVSEGARTVKVKAVHDSNGRSLDRTFQRTIQVTPQSLPTIPPEQYRRIKVQGTLVAKDDEGIWEPGKYETYSINALVYLDPIARTARLSYRSGCTGGEVNANVDVHLTLNADNISVTAEAFGKLYEGSSCEEDDLDATGYAGVSVGASQTQPLHLHMVNPELDSEDEGTLSITLENTQEQR